MGIADYVFQNCKPACLLGWCKQGLDSTAPAQFQFDIVYHEMREPATVPYLPMTYDVDTSTEWVARCDATAFVLHSPTDIRGTCTGNCCEHKGAVAQVRTPSNFESLDAQQKKAAVTYLYKDVSHFDVTWTLTRSVGGFMFMGSKGM